MRDAIPTTDVNEDRSEETAAGSDDTRTDEQREEARREELKLAFAEMKAMTVDALRKTLDDLGEETDGKKAELVARLWKRNYPNDPPPAETVKKVKKVKYAFPSVSRCPRCGVTDTAATSTQGDTQYRQCRRAVCRKSYSVQGTVV